MITQSISQLQGPFKGISSDGQKYNVFENFIPSEAYVSRVGVRGPFGTMFYMKDALTNITALYTIGKAGFLQFFDCKITELYFVKDTDDSILIDIVIKE